MARPSPVPPYLRLVEPSACWKASKMICCFSVEMPMPVSVTEKCHHLVGAVQVVVVGMPAGLASSIASVTCPRA